MKQQNYEQYIQEKEDRLENRDLTIKTKHYTINLYKEELNLFFWLKLYLNHIRYLK